MSHPVKEPSPAVGAPRPKVDLTRSITVWPWSIKRRRAIWQFLLKPIFVRLPGPANGARVLLLRLMGAQIGERCRVSAKVEVLMPWNLVLEPFVTLGRAVNV